jgi:hypothetical protein
MSWWSTGGISSCVAAYQAIGAASLAASYLNLANPGTNDAAPGTAPTFDASTGWTFNGSTQYLTTGVVPADGTWSMIVRYSDSVSTNMVCGSLNVRNGVKRFYISPYRAAYVEYGIGTLDFFQVAPALVTGVLAMAGTKCYRNGADEGVTATNNAGSSKPIFIGGINYDNTPSFLLACKVQAFAVYNATLTAPQVADVAAFMTMLPGGGGATPWLYLPRSARVIGVNQL